MFDKPFTIVWFEYRKQQPHDSAWRLDCISAGVNDPNRDDCSCGDEYRVGPFRVWIWPLAAQLRTIVPTALLTNHNAGDILSPFELLFGRKPL